MVTHLWNNEFFDKVTFSLCLLMGLFEDETDTLTENATMISHTLQMINGRLE